MRRAARIDENQPEIVKALLSVGACVHSTAAIGKGFPDIIVGFSGRIYLIEIKNPSKPKADRELTKAERKFHLLWAGYVSIVETEIEALKAIGAIK